MVREDSEAEEPSVAIATQVEFESYILHTSNLAPAAFTSLTVLVGKAIKHYVHSSDVLVSYP
jgi:hypothetical protein